jgi:hypothetical protein
MIIGLCGLAGSGKDTVADFLVNNHEFVKVALADPLKRICKDVFYFTDEQLWGPSAERNKLDERYPRKPTREEFIDGDRAEFLTPRHALQQLGTEWGRSCYNNVWVDYALRVADTLKRGGFYYDAKSGIRFLSHVQMQSDWVRGKSNVVISDVRFFNEVDAINNKGGRVWKIERPGAGLQGAAAAHASEKLDIPEEHFQHVIVNDGTLSQLEYGVGQLLRESTA